MPLTLWAAWGLAGAFVYAAPRLLVSIFDPPGGVRRPFKAWAEFFVAVAGGPIAAAGVGPFLAVEIAHTSDPESRALALVIGLVANPVAPAAVELWSNFALARLGHPLAPKPKARTVR